MKRLTVKLNIRIPCGTLGCGNEADCVKRLVKLAQSCHATTFVVMPPLRRDYRDALAHEPCASLGALHEVLIGLRDVAVIDLQSDGRFTSKDFTDMDHLNESGARKLSAILRAHMARYAATVDH